MTNLLNISSVTPVSMVNQQMSTTTETVVYTVAASTAAKIAAAVVTNVDVVACKMWVSIVRSGGSASDSNRVWHNRPIDPSESVSFKEYIADQWLNTGDKIAIKAERTGCLDVVISGLEFA